ncbi:hypothetical protein BCD_1113 (plasmid) [Borrelia crocidurae DOU]|uniref:Uncharacterized protein n=1 Tax=Borrelia crocidurae DOU TaxID=1293575 RepID=W5SJ54_9SPIR|nr:hypothetical protein [Borrelia crocidurae]AHH07179.1 hypothetical protein BCD_1113 [Borrelia crocidurae DOU]
MHYIAKRDHYDELFKFTEILQGGKFLEDIKQEIDWIKYNEECLMHLINQALISRSVGILPRGGGLFDQNYWFVLVYNELNLYIKQLENESISK